MPKIWFIKINERKEGPYSILELRRDKRVTPDTLVWKDGFPAWIPIRFVPELQAIFQDDETGENKLRPKKELGREEIVLEMRQDPPYFWMILIFLLLVLLIMQLLWNR